MGSITEQTLRGILKDVQAADPNIGDLDPRTMQAIIPHQEPHLLSLTNGKLSLSSRAIIDYGNVSDQAWQLHVQQIVRSFVPF
jgi:hypothetical protein